MDSPLLLSTRIEFSGPPEAFALSSAGEDQGSSVVSEGSGVGGQKEWGAGSPGSKASPATACGSPTKGRRRRKVPCIVSLFAVGDCGAAVSFEPVIEFLARAFECTAGPGDLNALEAWEVELASAVLSRKIFKVQKGRKHKASPEFLAYLTERVRSAQKRSEEKLRFVIKHLFRELRRPFSSPLPPPKRNSFFSKELPLSRRDSLLSGAAFAELDDSLLAEKEPLFARDSPSSPPSRLLAPPHRAGPPSPDPSFLPFNTPFFTRDSLSPGFENLNCSLSSGGSSESRFFSAYFQPFASGRQNFAQFRTKRGLQGSLPLNQLTSAFESPRVREGFRAFACCPRPEQSQLFASCISDIRPKLRKIFARWGRLDLSVLQDRLPVIINYFESNSQCKLPWTPCEIYHAIDYVRSVSNGYS